MEKRSLWHELALIGAPLLIVGGVLGRAQWMERLRTPRVALTVQFHKSEVKDVSTFSQAPNGVIKFDWRADLKGGPLLGYRFGWNERVVAQTPRGAFVVWELKSPPNRWKTDAVSDSSFAPSLWKTSPKGEAYTTIQVRGDFSSDQSLNHCTHSKSYEVLESTLPVDTQSVEWQGEMGAIPVADATIWQSPLPHRELQDWSIIEGGALWRRTVQLPYSAQKSSALLLRSHPAKEQSWRNDKLVEAKVVEVEIYSCTGNKRAFQRLIAFDGRTQRVLWRGSDTVNPYRGFMTSGSNPSSTQERTSVAFYLDKIPASWGEVRFVCDAIWDLSNRPYVFSASSMNSSEAGLNAFQRQSGGFRASKSLVLRPFASASRKK